MRMGAAAAPFRLASSTNRWAPSVRSGYVTGDEHSTGGPVSIPQVKSAGPSAWKVSTAATENVCDPFARPWKVTPEAHACSGLPSREHRKVVNGSSDVNSNVAESDVTVPEGPVV